MTSNNIVVPKDVWLQIIDKIETPEYKLPKFIRFGTECICSKHINRVTGRWADNTYNYKYYIIYTESKNQYRIFEHKHKKTYDMIEQFMEFYDNIK